MLHPWRIIRPVFSPSTVKWAFGCRTTAPTVTRQAAWRPSVPAVNAFRAESGVPPPVKSWLQTADENPVFTALLPAQSACGGIKWWWPTKHLWRGCKRDSFAHTHTHTRLFIYTIPLWQHEPEASLCDWHAVGLVAVFAHAVQWVRGKELWPRHSVGPLSAVFMHACVLCVRVYMCAWPQRSHLLSLCVSLRASPSSLSEGLRRKKKKKH